MRNYPYNCWWVAATSDEVGRKFVSRQILGMPVLLYRKEDGSAVAIEDRCPHRSTPLSLGTLSGDNVICGYHGFEFAPNGKCVRVPTQPSPGRISACVYPLIEQYPFIWIYTGDLACIDSVAKPMDAISWASEHSGSLVWGYQPIGANYMLLKENVLDLSHIPVVHATTLELDYVPPPKVTTQGDIVKFTGVLERRPVGQFYGMGAESGLDPEKIVEQIISGRFESPALQTATTELTDFDAAPGQRRDYRSFICHVTTPIDMRSMHYWWANGRDYGHYDDAFKRAFGAMVWSAFEEDKAVLEAVQNLKDRTQSQPATEHSVLADAGGIEARRALARWMARETLDLP